MNILNEFSSRTCCRSVGCIAYHVHDAVQAGATRKELLETIGVALLMGGGPGSIYAAHTMDAMDQFLPESLDAESQGDAS